MTSRMPRIMAAWALVLLMLRSIAIEAKVNAVTPQMGWNSWNTFKTNFNQSVIENTVSSMVATGLKDAGYNYIVLDEGWQAYERDTDGRQQVNSSKFPDGIKSLADDAGIYDCGFSPGSYDYEELDAATYAAWNIDYLKYDNCGGFAANTISPQSRFAVMRNALLSSGRDIFYSLCQWGHQFPWFWADQISPSYRMSGDIHTSFSVDTSNVCKTAYCLNTGYAGRIYDDLQDMREIWVSKSWFLGPADMDMLEIGKFSKNEFEERTHMSFWAALTSPLIIGADINNISSSSLGILLNKDFIAVNQDSLGTAVSYLPDVSIEGKTQLWAGPLSNGNRKYVVLALNEGNNTTNIKVPWTQILESSFQDNIYDIRELWTHQNHGLTNGTLVLQNVTSHETKVLVLS